MKTSEMFPMYKVMNKIVSLHVHYCTWILKTIRRNQNYLNYLDDVANFETLLKSKTQSNLLLLNKI